MATSWVLGALVSRPGETLPCDQHRDTLGSESTERAQLVQG